MYNSGRRGKRTNDGYGVISTADNFNQSQFPIPTVTSFSITDGSYNSLPDTAVDPAGGQTIVVNGSGFRPGATVMVGGTTIGTVTYIDQGRIAFTAPALSSASYTIIVTNSNGGTGILVPGLVYSGLPTWSTSAGSIGSLYETKPISQSFVATGDAPLTYALYSGSLPSGSSLASNGTLSGTAPADSGSTTYSFTIRAYDGQNQHSDRSFSLTINTDTVTWSNPTSNQVISAYEYRPITNVTASATSAAGYGVLYSANTVPGTVTLNANTGLISGTMGVAGNTYTQLTATANTTVRNATRNVIFNATQDVVTWTTPNTNQVITAYEYTPITNVTANATSAAGFGVLYTANAIPTGITLNANTGLISGTANTVGNTYSRLTATANTTVRNATRDVIFNVAQDIVTWSSPADQTAYSLAGGSVMANVTLSATSAAGRSITYTANALPSGVGISGNTIYGTPDTAQTVTTLLTATATTTNRTATRTISWSISLGDTYWKNVSLLLNGVTPTTTFINDASINNTQLTIAGDTKPNNFNPYTPGYYSNFFNASKLSVSGSGPGDFGTGDFTVECWVNLTINNGHWQGFYDTRSGGTGFFFGTDNGSLNLIYYYGGIVITDTTPLVLGQWYHVALVRSSGITKLYKNGVSVGTPYTDTNNYTSTVGVVSAQSGTNPDGYISNLRVLKGTALYTTTFTPPTTPLTAITNTQLLTCQSNRFIDKSNNNFSITVSGTVTVSPAIPFTANSSYSTYGSGSFPTDSGADYLRIPANSSGLKFTDDFTLEFWVYATGAETRQFFGTLGTDKFRLYVNSETLQLYGNNPGASLNVTASGAFPTTLTNQWVHVAISRTGANLYFFVNGVSKTITVNSGAVTDTIDFDNQSYIGTYSPSGAKGFQGYMADFRTIKGTGLYTANFTPPTTPLTAIANTSLLTLQYNGGATNNGFVDQSSFNNNITRYGNTTQGTFSPYSQTGWSTYFNGTNSYFTAPLTTALQGSFTLEFWLYANSISTINYLFVSGGANPMLLFMNSNGTITYYGNSGGSRITSNNAVSAGTWTHVALSRVGVYGSSGLVKMFINGVLQTQTYNDGGGDSWTVGTAYIGTDSSQNYFFPSYFSNFRLVVGSGLYTATFTPPTAPLTAIAGTQLLTCQSNRLIDNSPNNFTLTPVNSLPIQAFSPFGGVTSVPASYGTYFNGSTDYLTVASNAAFAAPGNFTFETWLNTNNNSGGNQNIINIGPYTSGLLFRIIPTGKLEMYIANSQVYSGASTVINNNTWYHVAVVRNSGTIYIYLNGTSLTSFSNSTALPTAAVSIGVAVHNTSEFFSGYMSNYRYVPGIAVYTTTFTPSTTPLTTTSQGVTASNVSLLTCQSSTIIDNSNNKFTITASGTPKVYSYNPFGITNTTQVAYSPSVNGGSMYFDGTGDYLTSPASPLWAFGTGDFTIECWFYSTNISASQELFDTRSGSTGAPLLWIVSSNLAYYIGGTVIQSNITLLSNQWYHAALVRSSGVSKLYLNGVLTGTPYTDSGNYTAQNIPYIGMGNDGGGPMFGYISDLRVTKGVAVYTSNFYPPVSPLTPTQTIGANTATAALLLSGTSGGIVDAHGTNNFETVGDTKLSPENPYSGSYYSNYFNGSTDYLYTANPNSISFGTGDFTWETWVYPTAITGNHSFFVFGSKQFYYPASGIPTFYSSGAVTTAASAVTVGKWYHVALVRSSGVVTIYLNGVPGTSVSYTTDLTDTTNKYIGAWSNGSDRMAGYMSNLRVTNTAVYTSSFTPSTSPLTAISGTLLLTCQSNKLVDNSANAYTLNVAGTTSVKTINPFRQNTEKSLYFDGTGDYLVTTGTGYTTTFGTGDYTVEFWVYFNTTSGTQNIIDGRPSGTASTSGYLNIAMVSGVLNCYNNGGSPMLGGPTIVPGQWYHYALSRVSGTTTLYINGTRYGSAVSDSGNYVTAANRPSFGQDGYGGGSNPNCYLKDIRITKGYGRYTANTTPPTTTFSVK